MEYGSTVLLEHHAKSITLYILPKTYFWLAIEYFKLNTFNNKHHCYMLNKFIHFILYNSVKKRYSSLFWTFFFLIVKHTHYNIGPTICTDFNDNLVELLEKDVWMHNFGRTQTKKHCSHVNNLIWSMVWWDQGFIYRSLMRCDEISHRFDTLFNLSNISKICCRLVNSAKSEG